MPVFLKVSPRGRLAAIVFAVLLLQSAEIPLCAADDEPVLKDFTEVSLESLKIKAVEPGVDDKNGFVIAGENPSSLISGLTKINGRTIAELEKEMRPGAASTKGFLGADEKLLDVLVQDNTYITETVGTTHQKLALHLRVMAAIGLQGQGAFLYHGGRFKITFQYSRGYQDSPFHDGTRGSTEATIENLETGKKLRYSLLVPEMIERYGFYEGEGTPYRVDPKKIVEVLPFLRKTP